MTQMSQRKKNSFQRLGVVSRAARLASSGGGWILTLVWKQECSWVRKLGLLDSARTRFSIIVHSTSSSWTMTSFFKTLTANIWSVPFSSASRTCRTRIIIASWTTPRAANRSIAESQLIERTWFFIELTRYPKRTFFERNLLNVLFV